MCTKHDITKQKHLYFLWTKKLVIHLFHNPITTLLGIMKMSTEQKNRILASLDEKNHSKNSQKQCEKVQAMPQSRSCRKMRIRPAGKEKV